MKGTCRSSHSRFFLGKFNREFDRSDHAVGLCESFAGDRKGGAVIGAGAGEWEPKRYVHAAMKGVQFERDQPLIVIHAKSGTPPPLRQTMKERVGRDRAGEDRV